MASPLVIVGLFVVNAPSVVFEVVASRKAATRLGATACTNSAGESGQETAGPAEHLRADAPPDHLIVDLRYIFWRK